MKWLIVILMMIIYLPVMADIDKYTVDEKIPIILHMIDEDGKWIGTPDTNHVQKYFCFASSTGVVFDSAYSGVGISNHQLGGADPANEAFLYRLDVAPDDSLGMYIWIGKCIDVDAGAIVAEQFHTGSYRVVANLADTAGLARKADVTELNDPTETEIYSHFISGGNEDQFKANITNLDVAVSTRLAPSTSGRTLDITTTGEAGIDLSNTNGSFIAGDFGAGCLNGKGDWNIGKTDYSLLSAQWADHRTALNSAHGSGSWATASGFATHSAADVYTHFTTGSNADAFKASTPLNFTSLSITAGGLANVNVEEIDSSVTAADYLRDILSGVARTLTLSNYNSFQDKASQSDIQAALTAQGYTSGRAPYLDNINHGIPSSVNYTSGRAANLDNLDAATTTRLAASAAPTNFNLLSINGSGYVTTIHGFPLYFSDMKISSGGYVSPNFSDVNGNLDTNTIDVRQMFSMNMSQYSTDDSSFGYACNPNNYVDSSTYYDWNKHPLNEAMAYLGSQVDCDIVRAILWPPDGTVPKDSVVIWCHSGTDSTRIAKKKYYHNITNTVVDTADYEYFGY